MISINDIYLDLTEQNYTDVVINLIDRNNSIKLPFHKIILGKSSKYFHGLFNFADNKTKTEFDVKVDNSKIAHDIILSFY